MQFTSLLLLLGMLLVTPLQAGELDWLDQGASLLQPFKQQLKAALQSGMQQGPAEAIDVCRLKAPEIAASLRTDDVRVGRSSHKLRNPTNAPQPWMKEILTAYLQDPSARKPVAVQLEDGLIGYVEPILLQPQCLACHGEQLPPEVAAVLDAQYPEDQATGFRTGDLRGIFWAEFPPG